MSTNVIKSFPEVSSKVKVPVLPSKALIPSKLIKFAPTFNALVIFEAETSIASTIPPLTPDEVINIASVTVDAVVSALSSEIKESVTWFAAVSVLVIFIALIVSPASPELFTIERSIPTKSSVASPSSA